VSGNEVGILIVESGMTVVFVIFLVVFTYIIRVNLLKSFEMTLCAEKSASIVTTIFNNMSDSIMLVSNVEDEEISVD
jgi:hypothetical protein